MHRGEKPLPLTSESFPPPTHQMSDDELDNMLNTTPPAPPPLPGLPLQSTEFTTPLPFSPPPIDTSDKEGLWAQLEVAKTNRSMVCLNAATTAEDMHHFTPAPKGGFPIIHFSHAAAPLDFVDNATINAWLQVQGPKFLVQVFDCDGKDHETMNASLTQCIRSTIIKIMNLHNFSQINVFTTSNPDLVTKSIRDMWTSPKVLGDIVMILEKSKIPPDRIYDAALYLCDSIAVEFIDYKGAKSIPLPHFNIFAKCPSNNPRIWMNLHAILMTMHYPTPLDGNGIAIPFMMCSLCHSIGHPNNLCKFPDIPSWNGPKLKNKSEKCTPKARGKGKEVHRSPFT
ncbi:hypothetical protein BDR07DRAFT_1501953 [Suillus spraguei]|nr:hypothetical protein BDR07DRAFT_1501953 [Suillus spraguei]